MRHKIRFAAALLAVLALAATATAAPGSGGAKSSSDSIWVIAPTGAAPVSSMSYGADFNAGYTSKDSGPWAHLQCFANSTTQLTYPTAGAILDEYRPGSGGVTAAFELADPLNSEWVGGGADCTLSLIVSQGSQSRVSATTSFTVS
jgi:hypothetical protein